MTDEDYTPEHDDNEDEEVNSDDEGAIADNDTGLPRMQNELKSDLGSYWGDGLAGALMDAEDKATNMLKNYSKMKASLSTQ